MIQKYYIILFLFFLSFTQTHAEESQPIETTVDLKHITGEDVSSVLNSLVDNSVSIQDTKNSLIIKGTAQKIKNILPIIQQIDTPPTPLTIEFIASNRKITFNNSTNTYQSRYNTSQSMSITERQWVTLNTGLSIPIAERVRHPDGTESQSFRYKKITKSYVFKVHEFSGWSVIQAGVNISSMSDDVAGAIEHTKLDTTIVGKTGEWLEVAASKPVTTNQSSQTYSTNRGNSNHIFLYVKVKETKLKDKTKETNTDVTK